MAKRELYMTFGSLNVYESIKNIDAAWREVTESNMNGVWKHLTPQYCNNFKGFDPEEEGKKVVASLIEISKALKLDLEAEDFEELFDSHSQELSNADLMELEEQQRLQFEEEKEEEPVPIKKFETKLLASAFSKFEEGLQLLEGQDPNVERFLKVQSTIQDALNCYHLIYDEKKRKTTQTSINSYFSRSSTPVADVSPDSIELPSTSDIQEESIDIPVDISDDDVVNSSTASTSSVSLQQ